MAMKIYKYNKKMNDELNKKIERVLNLLPPEDKEKKTETGRYKKLLVRFGREESKYKELFEYLETIGNEPFRSKESYDPPFFVTGSVGSLCFWLKNNDKTWTVNLDYICSYKQQLSID